MQCLSRKRLWKLARLYISFTLRSSMQNTVNQEEINNYEFYLFLNVEIKNPVCLDVHFISYLQPYYKFRTNQLALPMQLIAMISQRDNLCPCPYQLKGICILYWSKVFFSFSVSKPAKSSKCFPMFWRTSLPNGLPWLRLLTILDQWQKNHSPFGIGKSQKTASTIITVGRIV